LARVKSSENSNIHWLHALFAAGAASGTRVNPFAYTAATSGADDPKGENILIDDDDMSIITNSGLSRMHELGLNRVSCRIQHVTIRYINPTSLDKVEETAASR